jgi:hypothetical protein
MNEAPGIAAEGLADSFRVQPPVAANQEPVGLVTKTIGAMHGRGSISFASILASPRPG